MTDDVNALVERLGRTDLYEEFGGVSNLPDEAAEMIERQAARIAELEARDSAHCKTLVEIARTIVTHDRECPAPLDLDEYSAVMAPTQSGPPSGCVEGDGCPSETLRSTVCALGGVSGASRPDPLGERIENFIVSRFGVEALESLSERVARVFEEAAEVARAGGMSRDVADGLVERVYGTQDDGDLHKEAQDVGLTVLGLYRHLGFHWEDMLTAGLDRVERKSISAARLSHEKKVAAGLGMQLSVASGAQT